MAKTSPWWLSTHPTVANFWSAIMTIVLESGRSVGLGQIMEVQAGLLEMISLSTATQEVQIQQWLLTIKVRPILLAWPTITIQAVSDATAAFSSPNPMITVIHLASFRKS